MKKKNHHDTHPDAEIWHNVFPHTQCVRQLTKKELVEAVQNVIKKQAGALRLLERE